MKELINYLVEQFAGKDNFEIIVLEDEDIIEYKVLVDKEYIARVIGKGGRTSRAIRTLARASNTRRDKSIRVYVEER